MRTTEQERQQLIGILFPIIGAGLLLAAIISTTLTYRFINTASRAEGKVIRLSAGGAHPVIQFMPAGEAAVEFPGNGLINYAVGDKVTVLYLKEAQNPSGFQTNINTPGALWFTTLSLTWIGGGFVVGGFYAKHLSRSRR